MVPPGADKWLYMAAPLIVLAVALALALIGPLLLAGSLRLQDIVEAQRSLWFIAPHLVGAERMGRGRGREAALHSMLGRLCESPQKPARGSGKEEGQGSGKDFFS